MVEEDPIKLHREAEALYDNRKYEEATESFLRAAQLYEKVQNFFDASYSLLRLENACFS